MTFQMAPFLCYCLLFSDILFHKFDSSGFLVCNSSGANFSDTCLVKSKD